MKPWPVVGHQWAVQGLRQAVARDEIPHALLITGPASVGKQTLAQQLVAAMFCRADNDKPCGTCLACRKLRSGNHPDHVVVEPEGSTARLKIDQIRPVERFLALTPKEGTRKVVLISDFERATIGAANALLKTLEEPPSYAHLILLATDADLLLPTIVSRSQQIVLRPLPRRLVAEALVSEWLVEPGLAERLARISGGRMGWAVRAATHAETYERMQTTLELLVAILGQDLPTRFETAKVLVGESDVLPETLEYWLTFWRDVLLLHSQNDAALMHIEHRRTLEAVAGATDVERTVQVLSALEHAQSALLSNANKQLLVESLLLGMPVVAVA
ncbi:MAG: DNA polymerase III subunit delta' [Anaerolineae bacterium]|nr:DNA polymerase III subunit delta' [Anaerolineae bacterium]